MVGTTAKVGNSGAPRGLEGQALLGLIRALSDPEVAATRLERLAESEATAVAERETANVQIATATKTQAAADARIKQADERERQVHKAATESKADADVRNRLLVGRENAATSREREIERREKVLDTGEGAARQAAEALRPYLAAEAQ